MVHERLVKFQDDVTVDGELAGLEPATSWVRYRDDARPPGASRRVDLDEVPGACPKEGAAERGVGRDASDA